MTIVCNQAMFIFDEIDKMPEGLVDAVKPFIDYHEHVQGLDFRQTIFIFLSNTGGSKINEIALIAWKAGRHRESLTYKVSFVIKCNFIQTILKN